MFRWMYITAKGELVMYVCCGVSSMFRRKGERLAAHHIFQFVPLLISAMWICTLAEESNGG